MPEELKPSCYECAYYRACGTWWHIHAAIFSTTLIVLKPDDLEELARFVAGHCRAWDRREGEHSELH
jgi:hypothetical protein